MDAGADDSNQFSLGAFEHWAPAPHPDEFYQVAYGNVFSGQHKGSNDSDFIEYLKSAKADVVYTRHDVVGDHFLEHGWQRNNVGHDILEAHGLSPEKSNQPWGH